MPSDIAQQVNNTLTEVAIYKRYVENLNPDRVDLIEFRDTSLRVLNDVRSSLRSIYTWLGIRIGELTLVVQTTTEANLAESIEEVNAVITRVSTALDQVYNNLP